MRFHNFCHQLRCSPKKKVFTQNQAAFYLILLSIFKCSLKKKGFHSESSFDLSIVVSKFPDFAIVCAITIIFSKKFHGITGIFKVLQHKAQNANLFCHSKIFEATSVGVATHSLGSPGLHSLYVLIIQNKLYPKHPHTAHQAQKQRDTTFHHKTIKKTEATLGSTMTHLALNRLIM